MTWITSNTLVKVSVLCFYLTLFHPSRLFRLTTYILISLALCFGLAMYLVAFLIYPPFFKTRISAKHHATYGSFIEFAMAISLINATIDFAIILLPLPIIWKLELPKARKVTLTLMFSLGVV